jgi:hypothetical protein
MTVLTDSGAARTGFLHATGVRADLPVLTLDDLLELHQLLEDPDWLGKIGVGE